MILEIKWPTWSILTYWWRGYWVYLHTKKVWKVWKKYRESVSLFRWSRLEPRIYFKNAETELFERENEKLTNCLNWTKHTVAFDAMFPKRWIDHGTQIILNIALRRLYGVYKANNTKKHRRTLLTTNNNHEMFCWRTYKVLPLSEN